MNRDYSKFGRGFLCENLETKHTEQWIKNLPGEFLESLTRRREKLEITKKRFKTGE